MIWLPEYVNPVFQGQQIWNLMPESTLCPQELSCHRIHVWIASQHDCRTQQFHELQQEHETLGGTMNISYADAPRTKFKPPEPQQQENGSLKLICWVSVGHLS
jgi:hypothetical protein